MKVLYLFIVYRSPEFVYRTISKLSNGDNQFLIHVDASSKSDFSRLSEFENLKFTSKQYATPWGGWELALAVFDALKESQIWEWDYVCLLSESDYPVKSVDYISNYLSKSGKDHILINPLPCENPLETPGGHWLEGGRRRVECYALRLNPKQIATIEPRKLDLGNVRQMIKILRYNPLKIFEAVKILMSFPPRKRTTDVLCGGHQWFFLTRRTTDAIIDFANKHTSFIEDCKYTQCLDEIFFPTLVNAVADISNVSRNILRYISWSNNGDSSPENISINDKRTIDRCVNQSDILFIRKVSDLRVCDYVDTICL